MQYIFLSAERYLELRKIVITWVSGEKKNKTVKNVFNLDFGTETAK